MINPRSQQRSVLLVVSFFALILLFQLASNYGSSTQTIPSFVPSHIPTTVDSSTPRSKNAYVVFLNAAPEATTTTPSEVKKDLNQNPMVLQQIHDEDHYFTGTRMLLYQLKYAPETRTTTGIDFVVLVQKAFPLAMREQLAAEGAIVKEVEDVKFDWIKPGRERWAHVMTKLRVFQLVEYEKVLLLDCDVVVTRRLDGIFDDPAAQVQQNLGNKENIMSDEAPQPSTYIMAGNSGPARKDHEWPGLRGNRLNAGFVLLAPSEQMYQHQYSVASIEGRFPGGSPEQDLWNYVYSRERNMPWKQVDPAWTVNTPNYGDYVNGVASIHEKYWVTRLREDPQLRDVLLQSRFKMEGFFEAWHRMRE